MNFFVGQRVRILWSNDWPCLAGAEGRIVARVTLKPDDDQSCEWVVAPDLWGSPIAISPRDGEFHAFAPNSSQLEPIVPDGHRACDDDFKRDLDRLLERQGIAA